MLPKNCSLTDALDIARRVGCSVELRRGRWLVGAPDKSWLVEHSQHRHDASRALLVKLRRLAEEEAAMAVLTAKAAHAATRGVGA